MMRRIFYWFLVAALSSIVALLVQGMVLRPELSLTILRDDIIVEKKEKNSEIEILYRGDKLDRLTSSLIEIKNTGGTPILSKDIIEVLTIAFGNKILDATIESSTPSDIDAQVKLNGTSNEVAIVFPLLNPGEAFTIKTISTDIFQNIKVKARIAGIKAINENFNVREMKRQEAFGSLKFIALGALVIMIALGIHHTVLICKALGSGYFEKMKLFYFKRVIAPEFANKKDSLDWLGRILPVHNKEGANKEFREYLDSIVDPIDSKSVQNHLDLLVLKKKKADLSEMFQFMIMFLFVFLILGLPSFYAIKELMSFLKLTIISLI